MRKKDKIKKILLMIPIITSMCSASATAADSKTEVDIIPVEQNYNFSCWAACAVMAGRSVNESSSMTEFDVLNEFGYTAGSLEMQRRASNFAANGLKSFAGGQYTYGIYRITQLLDYGYPVEAIVGKYDSYGHRRGGHSVVIYASNYYNNTNQHSVWYIDPWDGESHVTAFHTFYSNFPSLIDNSAYTWKYDMTIYIPTK